MASEIATLALQLDTTAFKAGVAQATQATAQVGQAAARATVSAEQLGQTMSKTAAAAARFATEARSASTVDVSGAAASVQRLEASFVALSADVQALATETRGLASAAAAGFGGATRAAEQTERAIQEVGREAARSQSLVVGSAQRMEAAFGRAVQTLRGLAAAAGITLGVRELVQYADAATRLQNQLRLVTGSTAQLATAQDRLFQIAQATRGNYEQTVGVYARLARSTRDLNVDQDTLFRATTAVNRAIALSGTTAAGAEAALVQLGQGLAAGALRGEELNSILEQAPRLAEALAAGLGVGLGQLRRLGEEGALTTERVLAAVVSQFDTLEREAAQTSATVAQAFQTLQNSLLRAVGVQDGVAGATRSLAESLSGLARFLDANGPLLSGVTTFVTTLVPFAAGLYAVEKALTVLTPAVVRFSTALLASPFAPVILAIGALATALAVSAANTRAAADEFEAYKRSLGGLTEQQKYVALRREEFLIAQARQKLTAGGNDAGEVRRLQEEIRVRLKTAEGLKAVGAETGNVIRVTAQATTAADGYTSALTKLGTASARAADRGAEVLSDLRQQIADLVRLRGATEAVTAAVSRERAVREAGSRVSATQRKDAEALAGALFDLTAATDAAATAEQARRALFAREDAREAARLRAILSRQSAPGTIDPATGDAISQTLLDSEKLLKELRRTFGDPQAREEVEKFLREGMVRGLQSALADFLASGLRSFDEFAKQAGRLLGRVLSDAVATSLTSALAPVLKRATDFISRQLTQLTSGNLGAGFAGGLAGAGAGVAVGGLTSNPVKGAAGGAFAGAATGALVGTAIAPVIGTAIGAVVGAVTGLVGGLIGSSKRAREERQRQLQAEEAERQREAQRRAIQLNSEEAVRRESTLLALSLAGRDAEAEALRRQIELSEQYAAAINAGVSPEVLARYRELREIETKRLDAAREAARAQQRDDLLGDFRVRGLRLAGDERGAVETEAVIRAGQGAREATALFNQGIITEAQLAGIVAILNGEVRKALDDYDAALQAQADALAAAQAAFRDDLRVRELTARGESAAAERLRLALQQQREVTEAVAAGYDDATLAQLRFVQGLESAALAAGQAAAATERLAAAAQRQADLSASLAVREAQLFGAPGEAERLELGQRQQGERQEFEAAGLAFREVFGGARVPTQEYLRLLKVQAEELARLNAGQDAAALGGGGARAERSFAGPVIDGTAGGSVFSGGTVEQAAQAVGLARTQLEVERQQLAVLTAIRDGAGFGASGSSAVAAFAAIPAGGTSTLRIEFGTLRVSVDGEISDTAADRLADRLTQRIDRNLRRAADRQTRAGGGNRVPVA